MFINRIKCIDKKLSIQQQIIHTIAILLFGVILGVFSKYLDCTSSNKLPFLLEHLDVTNFLGRLAIWVFLAVCISVYSASPFRAAVNVFLFFAGMVSSYYLYSKFVAGFFPLRYAMIWVGFTAISPVLAFICWYSKGKHKVSLFLSASILAALFNMCFIYGWLYFNCRSILEVFVFISSVVLMKRQTMKENAIMIGISIGIALILNMIVPFHFG